MSNEKTGTDPSSNEGSGREEKGGTDPKGGSGAKPEGAPKTDDHGAKWPGGGKKGEDE